jgi:hypothetical protein
LSRMSPRAAVGCATRLRSGGPFKLSDAPGSGLFEAVSAEPKTTFQIHTQVWRGETTVQRTPVQNTVTAATATKEAGKAIMQTPQNPSSRKRDESILDTQTRRE